MFICRFVSGFAYKFLIQTFKRQNAKLFWNKAKTVQDMLRNNVCQKAYSESRVECDNNLTTFSEVEQLMGFHKKITGITNCNRHHCVSVVEGHDEQIMFL